MLVSIDFHQNNFSSHVERFREEIWGLGEGGPGWEELEMGVENVSCGVAEV